MVAACGLAHTEWHRLPQVLITAGGCSAVYYWLTVGGNIFYFEYMLTDLHADVLLFITTGAGG
jgi:hypothetical protein